MQETRSSHPTIVLFPSGLPFTPLGQPHVVKQPASQNPSRPVASREKPQLAKQPVRPVRPTTTTYEGAHATAPALSAESVPPVQANANTPENGLASVPRVSADRPRKKPRKIEVRSRGPEPSAGSNDVHQTSPND